MHTPERNAEYKLAALGLVTLAAVALIGWLTDPHVPTAHAQYSQTITQNLLTKSNLATIPPITNIGQGAHFFTVTSFNAPGGHVCAGVFNVQLTGSYNAPQSLGFILQGVPQATTYVLPTFSGTNVARAFQASGVYPALTLNFITADTTNCVFDAFYSGVIGGGIGPAVTELAGGYSIGFARGQGGTSTAGDTSIILGVGYSAYLSVYGVEICNATAGQSLIFKTNTGTAQGTYASYPNMAAGQCITEPPGQLPLWSAAQTFYASSLANIANLNTLVVNLANATPVTWNIWYRYE